MANITHGPRVVIYTDGGCNPNPDGPCGWGIHGYTYDPRNKPEVESLSINTPTDRGYFSTSIKSNPGIHRVKQLSQFDAWGGIIADKTSNNIAELQAAIKALEFVVENKFTHAYLTLDSNYVLDGIRTSLRRWKKNQWMTVARTPVKNKEFWLVLDDLLDKLNKSNVVLNWSWTKGHRDNIGNIKADDNATKGIQLSKAVILEPVYEIVPGDGTVQPRHQHITTLPILAKIEVDGVQKVPARSKLFSHTSWYFLSNMTEEAKSKDGRFVYYCGTHDKQKVKQGTSKLIADRRKNELLGKASGALRYSVIFKKEKEPVLATIETYHNEVTSNRYNNVIVCDLAVAMKQEIYDDLYLNGSKYLCKHVPLYNDVYTTSEHMVTFEASPPRLALTAVTHVQMLELVLECYLGNSTQLDVVAKDITNEIYDITEKKEKLIYKIKPFFKPGLPSIELPVAYNTTGKPGETNYPFTVGIHTPDRGVFSGMVNSSPKVSVVTWRESHEAFRCAFIVEGVDDCAIYAAANANLVFIKSDEATDGE